MFEGIAQNSPVERRDVVLGIPAALGLVVTGPLFAGPMSAGSAHYTVTLLSLRPLRFAVLADLPIGGARVDMSSTYPAELPEMAAKGWPALIKDLTVTGSDGRPITATPATRGWQLARHVEGRIACRYTVDFSIFQEAGWPSPLESAVMDDGHIVVGCRGLFVITARMASADVVFRLPSEWRAVAPWPALNAHREAFRVKSIEDLTDNMLALSKNRPRTVSTANFTLEIVAMGHWLPLQSRIRQALHSIIAVEVGMMGYVQRETYSVILAPTIDTGGEAYRQSFIYCFDNPTAENVGIWANTLAHEIFHYWNYARLSGRDYAATQWFQEGFTEYVANLTLLVGKIASPAWFLAKLSEHISNYSRLTTTLEAIGNHKGPPLYSAGALVAFSFDAMIRHVTRGEHTIGTFFRRLWQYTRGGAKKYDWQDIEAALRATAPGDWQSNYDRYIRGAERLPVERSLGLAGLRLGRGTDGAPQVGEDPTASSDALRVWRSLKSNV